MYYKRHKDAIWHDYNNIDSGLEIRKLTMMIFLNEEGPGEARQQDPLQMGAVRLILEDENIDVVPRMGRALLFKSEIVEH